MSAISYELKELKKNFRKLETDPTISCNVNEKLTQQLILIERKWWTNEQYSRRKYFEFSVILESVQNDVFEECISKMFNECDTPVNPANIEACHNLKSKAKSKKFIIKLSKRKDVFRFLQRKKKLKSVHITNVGLPQWSLVFINQSLCSYYKYLLFSCQRLHSQKMMHLFWVTSGNVSLNVLENTPVLLLKHVSDMHKHFDMKVLVADVNISSFSVVFISCTLFVPFWLFCFTMKYCQYSETSFESSVKSILEIYKPF